jgi:hypothetical protein
MSINTQVSIYYKDTMSADKLLYESLILAQDERWRRA